ncbi:sulfatase [Gordonia sp. LSe1-13]|uniref:Sulfatase n=1 Tax=Gordonia sesuvii TaxID=3116777 RepID=A0ABU7MJ19_9ACTN|nr:sulfatase [Gordonia sp. LSe1-13]
MSPSAREGLSRRGLIAGSGSLLGAAIVGAALRPARASGDPPRMPNFLVLVSEDCGAQHLGVYGGPARTPTIDALAADGIRWANAFASSPVCAPSRFALITGVAAEESAPANQMRAAGELPPQLGGAGWTRYLRERGYYCTNNAKEDYNASGLSTAATWDESSGTAHWRNRPRGAPFYAVFNPTMTHELSMAFAAPDVEGISTPYLEELTAIHAVAPTPILGGPTRPEDVRIPGYCPDTPTTRTDAASYMNQINQMDAELAFRLRELAEAGLADDTIVLYFSDHGGVLPRSKRFCYDSGLRIPLIARFGRNVAHLAPASPGSSVDDPVCVSTALAPTILDLAGAPVPEWMSGVPFAGGSTVRATYAFGGRNRMDERYDFVRTVRDSRFRYIRNYMPQVPNGQHIQFMWLQAGYREWETLHRAGSLPERQDRFWRRRPAEELYDLVEDPDELTNLAARPAYRGELVRLRTALDEHMLAVNDNGFIAEGAPAEGFTRSRDRDTYPLDDVIVLAGAALERHPLHRDGLADLLGHRNDVIRFWAAAGLGLHGRAASSLRARLRHAFETEQAPHVKVVLAEALVTSVADRRALDHLAWALSSHPGGWIRLQAANALDRLGPAAMPVASALGAAATTVGGDEPVALTRTAAGHTYRTLHRWPAGIP